MFEAKPSGTKNKFCEGFPEFIHLGIEMAILSAIFCSSQGSESLGCQC